MNYDIEFRKKIKPPSRSMWNWEAILKKIDAMEPEDNFDIPLTMRTAVYCRCAQRGWAMTSTLVEEEKDGKKMVRFWKKGKADHRRWTCVDVPKEVV